VHKGNRDQQGNLGQGGKDSMTPAGASGRDGDSGTAQPGNADTNRPASRPRRNDDDEDSGLGNRTGLR
jgi:hypothetical protein